MNDKYRINNETDNQRYHDQTGNHPDGVVTKIDYDSESKRENFFRGEVDKLPDNYIDYTIDGKVYPYPEIGRGPSEIVSSDGEVVPGKELEQLKDDNGFTHPNLHRRVDPGDPELPEVLPRKYGLEIANLNSYRTTHVITNKEDTFDRIIYVDDEGNEVDISEIP